MSEELIQQQYENLCKQLGHAINNRNKLDAKISNLEKQIDVLNEASSVLEQARKAEMAKQQLMAQKAAAEAANAEEQSE